jgi:uncharacterized protein
MNTKELTNNGHMLIIAPETRMPRPHRERAVFARPGAAIFKPAGVPIREMEEVEMTLDEFESLRLCDLDGFYQEDAAEHMGVSRATFSRILERARRKTAYVLLKGAALRIQGGPVRCSDRRCCRHHDNVKT